MMFPHYLSNKTQEEIPQNKRKRNAFRLLTLLCGLLYTGYNLALAVILLKRALIQ